jgi:hypothetical protein
MSASTQISEPVNATSLLSRYIRWLLLYCFAVLTLWVLGIEALFEHPTPFYGYFSGNFGNRFSFFALATLLALCALVLQRTLFPQGKTRRGTISALVFCGICFVLSCLSLVSREQSALEIAATGWATLRLHLLVIVVFTSGFGLLFSLFEFMAWPEKELSFKGARWFIVGLYLFCILFTASMAMTRSGKRGISQSYERPTTEYIADVGKGLTIRGLFRDYNQMHPFLSIHSKVHPPGPIAVLWVLSYAAGREPFGLALATIVFGSLAVFPFFALAKDVAGQRAAIIASLCFALMPSIVLFTATSADVLFMPFTVTTLLLFWRAIHRNSISYALAAGVGYALCSLMTFSLLALGGFFAFAGLWRLASREYRIAVVKTAVFMLLAFGLMHVAVRLWSGFDVVECFRLSKAQFDADQIEVDRVHPRFPGWLFRFINPLCFIYFAGIPMTLLFFSNLFRPAPNQKSIMIVLAGTLFVLNLLYIARGEGERSAMYIMPFIALGAGLGLDHIVGRVKNLAPLAATLSFLAFQCWLTETILYTYW